MAKKRKQDKPSKAEVIIPGNLDVLPEKHEIDAAWILAHHFDCHVVFIKPNSGYKIKTPDFEMLGHEWELKSPVGKSKEHTVKRQFMNAKGKNHYMVIDGRRTRLRDDFVIGKIKFELEKHPDVIRLIYIKKSGEVLEIK